MRASFFNLRRIILIVLITILFITMVFDKPIQAGAALPNVRVGLLQNHQTVTFGVNTGTYNLENLDKDGGVIVSNLKAGDLVEAKRVGSLISVRVKKAGGNWGDPIGAFGGPVKLKATTNSGIVSEGDSTSSNRYRGEIVVRLNSSKTSLNLINELLLEEYLYGVVPKEMSAGWHIEALKAQAVAARTFAVKRLNSKGSEGFDLYPDTRDQAYGGYDLEVELGSYYMGRVFSAVDGTAGKVIYSNGELIDASYHSNSGGHTEDVENEWGASDSYRRGKKDQYSLKRPHGSWYYQTDIAIIKDKVGSTEAIDKLELVKLNSGRVKEVIITDIKGNTIKKLGTDGIFHNFTGYEFGKLFNAKFDPKVNEFISRFFDFDTTATVSIINGSGQVTTLHGGGKSLKVINGANQVIGINGTNASYEVLGGSSQKTISKNLSGVTVEGHGWGHGVGMSQYGALEMANQGKTYDQILKFYYSGVKIQ